MQSKKKIMKAIGKTNSAEFPSVASVNEYLFLEVLCDIRDQLAAINQTPVKVRVG